MKNTHEPFDDELRKRLLHYTEEPDKHLWNGIAPNIVSVHPEAGWVVWSTNLSVVIVISFFFLLYPNGDRPFYQTVVDQSGSEAADLEISGMVPSRQPRDPSETKEIRSNEGGIKIAALVYAASDQHQLTSSSIPVPAEEIFSPIVFDAPMLSTNESVTIISRQSPSDAALLIQNGNDKALSSNNSIEKKKSSKLNKKLRKHTPFSFYITAMPTFGYQRIATNNRDNIFIQGIKRVPAFSFARLGVRIEAGTEVPISKRWTAFGGVLYYQQKQTIAYTETRVDTLIFSSKPGGDVTVEPELNYLPRSTEYELKNVGLQAGISYRLWIKNKKRMTTGEALSSENLLMPKRKFSHLVGSGLEFHKPLNRARSLQRTEGFSDPSMYVFFNLYYRLQYPDKGRLRAIFQPTLNYSFYINEDLNAPFYVKPYGLGLNFGCTYHLR